MRQTTSPPPNKGVQCHAIRIDSQGRLCGGLVTTPPPGWDDPNYYDEHNHIVNCSTRRPGT